MEPILHIIPSEIWARVRESGQPYRGDTLDAEGFIHFSRAYQVERVANTNFRGHTGLQLLVIDPSLITEELREEAPFEDSGSGETFPHVYGPLNLDAVIDVVDFEPNEDGTFTLPEQLKRSAE